MNLGGKLSGLKGLVSQSQGKRRFKGDLTPDMISPPLADFRHTMHVGRGGDVFGDTSFLSNHGGTANGNGDTDSMTSPDNKIGAFFSRTLRHVRKTPDRPRGDSKDLSPPPPLISPIIKNAISLPRLDVELSNGGSPTKTLFSSPAKTQDETTFSYGLESGFVTLPRHSRSERQQSSGSTSCSPDIHCVSLTDTTDAIQSVSSTPKLTLNPDLIRSASLISLTSLTSLTSFTFDLGPSLMSEVFGLIDSPKVQLGPSHTWEGEELEHSFAYGGSEMDSATISLVDSLLRDDCGSRKSPYGLEWTEEDEEAEASMKESMNSQLSPKDQMGSPAWERLGMESRGSQSVTDIQTPHHVGEPQQGQLPKMNAVGEILTNHLRMKPSSYSYTDEEEEIKV